MARKEAGSVSNTGENSLINTGKIRARDIVISTGLDEKAVEDYLDKQTERLTEQLTREIRAQRHAVTEDVAKQVGALVESKFIEYVCNIKDAQSQSEERIEAAVQKRFEDLQSGQAVLFKSFIAQLTEKLSEDKSLLESMQALQQKANYLAEQYYSALDRRLDEVQRDLGRIIEREAKRDQREEDYCERNLLLGYRALQAAEFELAKERFNEATKAATGGMSADAYFGMALAEWKIQLIWDDVANAERFILFDYNMDLFENHGSYREALDNASDEQKSVFRGFVKKLKSSRKHICEYRDKGLSYDCFICTKVSEYKDGPYTDDYEWIKEQQVYEGLKKLGVNPFFSDVDCKEQRAKQGTIEYESLIHYALSRVKIMLLVCSKEEYRKTPWVENEINRFCKFCEKRGKNPFDRIIVVYKDTVIELEDDLDGKYEEWDRAEPVKEILQGVANAVKNAGEYVESGLKYCPICGKSYLLDAMFCNSAKCPAPGTTLVDALEWANRKSDRDKDALELEREKNEAQKREIEKLRQRIAILEEQFASTKFCLFCGQENPKHAKVCMECGGRTFSETRQPVSQSAPEPKPQQKPAPQPAPEITPTLDDKPEFQIEGTILKRYIGKAAKVQIPLGVTSIGDKAFLDCGWLKQVVIPDSVNSIGKRAFFGCNGLEYIEVAKGNAVYRSENNCLIKRRSKTLILGCNTSVIPLGVTTIGQDAFRGCSGLAGIVIPEGITSIGGDAFRGCSGLTGIVIPESVTLIGKRAFFECNGLDYIEVAKGNAVYRSENDCLIEKRSKALILGCRNSMIPDSVVSIGEYAFYGYSDLTSITIPDSVTSIGTQAFWGCNSLTIYCEAPEEPSCWGKAWNVKNREANGNCPVVWGSPRPGFWRQRGSKLRGNMQKPIPKPSDSAPQKKSANQHGFGKLKAEKRFEIKKLCKPFYPLHNDYDKKWHYLRGRRER